jgi:hypothetical protein
MRAQPKAPGDGTRRVEAYGRGELGPADGARGTTSVCGQSAQRAGAYGRSVLGSDGRTRGKQISYAVGAARPGVSLSQ